MFSEKLFRLLVRDRARVKPQLDDMGNVVEEEFVRSADVFDDPNPTYDSKEKYEEKPSK